MKKTLSILIVLVAAMGGTGLNAQTTNAPAQRPAPATIAVIQPVAIPLTNAPAVTPPTVKYSRLIVPVPAAQAAPYLALVNQIHALSGAVIPPGAVSQSGTFVIYSDGSLLYVESLCQSSQLPAPRPAPTH
jgi:hypothetical protein